MKLSHLVCFPALALLLGGGVAAAAPAAEAPNILLILADDLGRADVGFMGAKEIRTPHLDKLAASGARLDSFYVQPVCSPTRAAMMTGRYPIRYGFQTGVIRPWETRGLPLQERLLPQGLKSAGYTTAICGKWHLGMHERAYLPTSRGFDHQYGHYCGALDYFTHERDGAFDWHRDDKVCRDEGYSTHLVAHEAVRLLKAFPAQRPFFLYVPFNAVHAPLQVPDQYKQPYGALPEPRRTYAGMIAAMDEAVGQILDALEARGLRTNTLVFFSSDNGGPAPDRLTSNRPLRAGKGTVYEGGVRVCACVSWPGRIQAGSTISEPLHAVDFYPTLLKVAGASLEQKLPIDGKDILPVLSKNQPSPHEEILINAAGESGAIRAGDWKLVLKGATPTASEGDESPAPKKKKAQRKAQPQPDVELFNLAQDISEANNLAEAQPEKVKDLRRRWEKYAAAAVTPRNQPKPANFQPPKVWGESAR